MIGVEVSPELNAIAARNLDLARSRLRCRDIELVTADVADFAIPDDLTVVYLYNPFGAETLRRVIDHVEESLARRPRRFVWV